MTTKDVNDISKCAICGNHLHFGEGVFYHGMRFCFPCWDEKYPVDMDIDLEEEALKSEVQNGEVNDGSGCEGMTGPYQPPINLHDLFIKCLTANGIRYSTRKVNKFTHSLDKQWKVPAQLVTIDQVGMMDPIFIWFKEDGQLF